MMVRTLAGLALVCLGLNGSLLFANEQSAHNLVERSTSKDGAR